LARSFAQMARSAEQGGNSVLVPKVPVERPPLEIHKLGSKELRAPARRISKVDVSVRDLARDMLRSMYTAKGIGLAAPQVGVHRQLLVIDLDLEEAATPPRSPPPAPPSTPTRRAASASPASISMWCVRRWWR
jgi:peptide deformylase